jgi:hypothetical protein
VARPAQECAKRCAFLGVRYEPDMLRLQKGWTRAASGLNAKNAWQPITPRLRDWRTQMSCPRVSRDREIMGGTFSGGLETTEYVVALVRHDGHSLNTLEDRLHTFDRREDAECLAGELADFLGGRGAV